MIAPEQIAVLEALDAHAARVLSVYLGLDPARQVRRTYRVAFEDLARDSGTRLEEKERVELAQEAARVGEWLAEEKPRGLGVAVFSCAPRGLWQAHFLPVPVEDHLVFEPRPDLAPLLRILDDYERYAIALVDKRKARLFTVFLGAIEEIDAFADDVPGKHDQGGPAQARFQRHHEAHMYWHLKRVALRLADLLRRRRFDRLILAGPEEATSELPRLLPRALAHRMVAVVPAEVSASDGEILEKTLEIERRVEREHEERLVGELLEAAGPGGRAILGLRPTLEALWLGRVQTLAVAHDLHLEGGECPDCGRLTPESLAACAGCGAAMRPTHDVVHRAMNHAHEQAGSVEVVHGDAARRLWETGGGLGARLRYPAAAPTNGARMAQAERE
jgi:peptide chain release factor subunit 1